MDFRAKEASWLMQAEALFNGGATVVEDVDRKSCNELKMKLKSCLQRRVRIWWNQFSLSNYLTKSLIPRGLRIQLFPSYGIENVNFCNKWEEICNLCSRSLIQAIIDFNVQTLDSLVIEIEEIEKSLTAQLTKEEMIMFKTELDENAKIWEKQVTAVKTRKFQRDSQDLANNRIYKWKSNNVDQRNRSASISSAASTSAESNVSNRSQRQAKRRNPYYVRPKGKRMARDNYKGDKGNQALQG